METFITVASWIYFVFYTVWLGLIVYAFMDLTPWEQQKAKITINGKGFIAYMLAISWIISRWIS